MGGVDKPTPAPEPDPLMGIDAQKWAKEFMRIWSGRWSEVDEALMIGWFANAIMRGYDEGQRRLRKQHGCEIPPLGEEPQSKPAKPPEPCLCVECAPAKPPEAPKVDEKERKHLWRRAMKMKAAEYDKCSVCGIVCTASVVDTVCTATAPAPEPQGSAMKPRCAWEPGTPGECAAYLALRAELASAREERDQYAGKLVQQVAKTATERASRERAEARVRELEDLLISAACVNGAYHECVCGAGKPCREAAAILAARKGEKR